MSTILIPNPDTPFFQADNPDATDGGQIISADFTTDTDDGYLGSEGSDLIFTFGGDDAVLAGDGDDQVTAGAGDDSVAGGEGDDLISLGEGDDLGLGGIGNDVLDGGGGDDLILGGDGSDSLVGGTGDDTLDGGEPDSDNIKATINFEFKFGEDGLEGGLNGELEGTLGEFKDLASDIKNRIDGLIDEAADTISNAADQAIDEINNAADAIGDAVDQAIDEINNILKGSDNDNESLAFSTNLKSSLSSEQVVNELFNSINLSIENLSQILQDNELSIIDEQLQSLTEEIFITFQSDNLFGGLGNDLLIGGSGADNFQFDNITPGEMDTIADFTPGVDKIQFVSSDFLSEEGEFSYNAETGIVSYNPDGVVDNGDEINFLQLQGDLDLNIDEDFEFL